MSVLQALKRELEEMGMFASEYKHADSCSMHEAIGVVTAPTGAAVRDIIEHFQTKKSFCAAYPVPGACAGRGREGEHCQRYTDVGMQDDIDVMIVGRGGGSIEDLWAFNEEEVARAIFDCRTPVISAVGHETDTTDCRLCGRSSSTDSFCSGRTWQCMITGRHRNRWM